MPAEPVDYFRARSLTTQRPQGRHGLRNAARHNVLKIRKVGIHVQREAVGSHPAAQMNSDRGDFGSARPHAGETGNPLRRNPKISQRIDDYLLDSPDI